ncbi:microsomal triacylglycerol transfer protein isoform X2 [Schistocerca nitens]|uniref:microsomal triacylglycerol transfer protein isoform X2 n=1 Tax=Schistocerca nitens TaxID=7011 RepID=UPI00211928B6|nr:microsomal triacylglycerol transfer protein isoform X2 [Schistocerca nitens]
MTCVVVRWEGRLVGRSERAAAQSVRTVAVVVFGSRPPTAAPPRQFHSHRHNTAAAMRRALTLIVVFSALGPMCHMAPAAGAGGGGVDDGVFAAGHGQRYSLQSTILLNDAAATGKDVGFQVTGEVTAGAVWQRGGERLLRLELLNPRLHIKSRKAPSPEGFVGHASKLDTTNNSPFYVHWNNGKVEHMFVASGEDLSMVNLKKGIASLFQFQLLDVETTEKDASGKCLVKYTATDPRSFTKTKTECVSPKTVPYIAHPEQVLSALVNSQRTSKYTMTGDLLAIDSVIATETHEMFVAIRQDAGSSIKAVLELSRTGRFEITDTVQAESVDAALTQVQEMQRTEFSKQILITEREPRICQDDCPNLHTVLKENKKFLKKDNLGTIRSATAFLKLLMVVRESKKEDLYKILKYTKNEETVLQLLDVLGAAQTAAAHEAAMKYLQLRDDSKLEENERYFWALSLGSHPIPQIVKGVLKLSHETNPSEKLEETIILTAAALSNRLSHLPGSEQHKVIEETRKSLVDGLNDCSSEECKQKYLRALRNLGDGNTVPVLLQHAVNGTKKTSVTAMKALRSLPSKYWDQTVISLMKRIYFQLDKKYDSSARTLATDILLETNPDKSFLKEILISLTSLDTAYEVKQYLWQRVTQISERDLQFRSLVNEIITEEKRLLKNYHAMALRGLSTAFTRSLFSNPYGNASLVTIQEISSGFLKRGTVDVVLEMNGETKEIFNLGLFAGGLSSLISSDDSDEPDDEPATAGMEVTALGVQLRPFIFFSGQGDLMGHVWSGTASEKTPAFQALALLHDHLQYLPLQPGFVAELSLIGAVSFDLSGQIQLSLWNRNAHSLVEKNAALVLQGRIKVDTEFVRSQADFTISTESSLNLVSDIDFSNNIALCLQLKQPDSSVRHNVFKVERIPGSKHRLRKSKYKVIPVSGRTFALNRKNNEMCSAIFEN